MQSESSNTVSLWMATASIPQAAALTTNLQCDVCVVGAGIAGLTTAYLLAREGRNVIVLDRSLMGGGETSRTTIPETGAVDARTFSRHLANRLQVVGAGDGTSGRCCLHRAKSAE